MNNQRILELKLNYLYEQLEKTGDFNSHQQQEFLLEEIDYHKTQLLKLETAKRLKEIGNEQVR